MGGLKGVHHDGTIDLETEVISPVRGGVKPGMQLHFIGAYSLTPIWLPFTAGGEGQYGEEIRAVLEFRQNVMCYTDFLKKCLISIDTYRSEKRCTNEVGPMA